MTEKRSFYLWDKGNRKKVEVEAKKAGLEWVAFCPFHSDQKTPNLNINDIKRVYYCFACGAKGHLFEPGFENKKRPIEEIYDYEDKEGKLLYQVVRFKVSGSEKTLKFKQRRPNGKGGWIWNLKGVKRVIYNLPEVLKRPGKMLFIPEGEKCCNNLTKIGVLATTNSGGAGKWRAEYNRYLKGRKAPVVLLPDNDEIGFKHDQEIGKSVKGIIKSIKWLILPGLKKGEDVSDWLERGGDLEKLSELVKTCPEFIPQPEEKEEPKGIRGEYFRATDLRNSEKFSKKYIGQLIYCQPWTNWLIYTEGKWKIESKRETQELSKKVILDYYKEASEMLDDRTRQNLIKEALKCESQRAIRAMIDLATSSMARLPEDFDQDFYILNLKNVTIEDLENMKFREHRPEDMLTKIMNVNYEPGAKCPKWLNFLDKIFEENKNLINYIQNALGYSLTGDTGEQCMFILYGIGANGKSTFINVIHEILGDYAINTPFSTFLSKGRGDNIPNDLARLRGARFVSAVEAPGERRFNEVLLKTIVGGDLITARFLRQEFFDFYPECKIWLATNHKPIVKEFSLGFWRKIRLIPFKIIISEEERILHYDKILLEEKEGIFNWLLEGYKKWRKEGLRTPEEIIEATAEYKSSMDVVAEFIEECCVESHRLQIATKEIYKAYKDWCEEGGDRPVNKNAFSRQLTERGYKSIRTKSPKQERGWLGINLKTYEAEKLPFDKN
ncbi:DNA primase [subsurface metagenome]